MDSSSNITDASSSRRRSRNYKPRREENEENGDTSSNEYSETNSNNDALILKPAEWTLRLIAFQIRILLQVFSVISWILGSCFSIISQPVHRTIQAKERATEAVAQRLEALWQLPPKVTEGGGIVFRKVGLGCVAATYAFFVLSSLLLFCVFLGFAFMNWWVEKPLIVKEPLYFDYTLPNPSANVSLANYHTMTDKFGWRVVRPGHKFRARIVFLVPESDHNRQIGMFQVTAELLSGGDEMIARFSQPAMLRFRSTQIRLAKILAMGLPLVMGILGETQTLVIDLFEHIEKNIPMQGVKIMLQPKSGTLGLPELYSADIDLRSKLPWVKAIANNWKWTLSVWNSLVLYFILLVLLLCCCRPVLFPRMLNRRNREQETKSEEGSNNQSPEPSLSIPAGRLRRDRGKHVSFKREPLLSDLRSVAGAHEAAEHSGRQIISEETIVSAVADRSRQQSGRNHTSEHQTSESIPAITRHAEQSSTSDVSVESS